MSEQADLFEGRRLRDEGLDRVEANYPSYLDLARRAAVTCAVLNGRVSINDVRKMIGPPPPEVHHNVMGAVFRDKRWRQIDIEQVRHAAGHARRVLVYELR